MTPRVLALADDATGALEIGARFGEAGLPSRVRFDRALDDPADAMVIDTETRHHPVEQAYQEIRAIAQQARRTGVGHVFYKTDSTLRGPIAAGFRALLEAWPELPLVYAPAYPALGRTVRNGELHVDGLPLAQTAFAADPLNPSREGSIAALLRPVGSELQQRIRVCDGQTDEDLAAVADSIRGTPCLMAGTAAMASVWARSLSAVVKRQCQPLAIVRRCLVVNGSLHPASRAQLASSGIPIEVQCPDSDPLHIAEKIERCGWTALCGPLERSGDPLALASQIARTAAHAIRIAAPDCLVVFGGDTAFAILRELNVRDAEPLAEILPGVPASTIRTDRPMLLVTKAGGFGTPDYLLRIREILEKA